VRESLQGRPRTRFSCRC